ncbi:MAG: carbohydrate ABC transporter permease, partial [bacterium]
IMGAGIILRMEQSWYMASLTEGIEEEGQNVMLTGMFMQNLLIELNLPNIMVEYVINGVNRLPEIIRASAIQILIFLAGLQSISSSLYESAKIEGATGWESFWKITLPMISPLIATNFVYTVVDSYLAVDNEVTEIIENAVFRKGAFGASSAMAIIYFLIIALILLISLTLLSKWIFYHE